MSPARVYWAFCPSVFSSFWTAGSLEICSGQSSLVGSIIIGGSMFKHFDWAPNSSASSCVTSLLLLNRYKRRRFFDLLLKRITTQSGQDVWRKFTVMLNSSKLKLLPPNVMLELIYWQLPPKLKTRVKDILEVSLTKLMLALSLRLKFSSWAGLLRLPAIKDHLPTKWWRSSWSKGWTESTQARGTEWLIDTKQETAMAHTANISLYVDIIWLCWT